MGASKKTRRGSSLPPPPSTTKGRSLSVRNKTSPKSTISKNSETSPKSTVKENVSIASKEDPGKEDEAATQETSVKKIKKAINSNDMTPLSPVRRSGRAPVPSSRFRDMEMGGASSRKRSLATSMSEESDGDAEPLAKKSKKISDKVQKSPVKEEDKRIVKEDKSTVKEEDKRTVKEKDKSTVEKEKSTVEKDKSIVKEEDKIPIKEEDKSTLKEKDKIDVLEEAPEEERENVHVVVSESKLEDRMTEPEKTVEICVQESAKMEIKEEEEEVTENVTISKEQDDSSKISNIMEVSNEVALSPLATSKTLEDGENIEDCSPLEADSCISTGMVIEETVHTFMDEKDVIVVKKPQDNLKSSALALSSILSNSGEVKTHSRTPEIIIKSQEVTLEEKDGQTVAIIKVPTNFGSDHAVPSETEKPSASTISNENSSTFGAKGFTRKNSRHGYILNKSLDEQSTLTVSEEDSTSVVNVALDQNTVKLVSKPKTDSTASKAPVKNYGRVIKQEPSINTVVIKTPQQTSLLDTHAGTSNIVIQNVGSTQPYSLLPQTIKAVSQTEGKTYSLLAPPTELKQMLKGVNEKKFPTKPNVPADHAKLSEVPSSSQKVIIIAPSSTSDNKVVTVPAIDSDSENTASGVGTCQEKVGELLLISENATSQTFVTTDNHETHGPLAEEKRLESEILTEERTDGEATCKSKSLDAEGKVGGSDQVESDIKSLETVQFESEISDTGKKASNVPENEKLGELLNNIVQAADKKSEGEEQFKDISPDKDEEDKTGVIESEGEKLPVEEVVVTSTDGGTTIKVEGPEEEISVPPVNLLSTALAEVEKSQNSGTLKPQKIKLIENGVVYEFQIFPDEEGKTSEETIGDEAVEVKQEVNDGEGSTVDQDVKKLSSGTQTFYSNKKGRPKNSDDADESEQPVHKLATIVQEGDLRKHYYYVSVVPGKTLVGKYRHSVDPSLPGCMVNKLGEYCCKECKYKTDKKANFYKHRRLHTGAKPHLCPVCKYQARTSSNLKRHMGIHEDIREFKCTQCSMSFRQKIHLERHVRYRHEEKRVKCPMCDYVCANEQPDLKMHIKRKHTQESGKTFSCPECKLVVGSRRDLKQHLKFHKDGPELKLFCKECSFVTDCKSRLQRHLVVHSNVKPFQCGVCDYKATQKEHVLRHLRSQHKIEVNKPKRPWKKQSKSDTPESAQGNPKGDFTCGDKIFACNHCIMRFAKLINLYKHLHTQHSDIMPVETEGNYYCVVCEFSTSSKKNLLVHMRRHNMTDQTPPTHVYSCVLCRYVNPRRRNLFQHMRKKHNIDISSQVDIAGMKEEEANAAQEGVKVTELIQTEEGIYTQGSSGDVSNAPVDSSDGNVRVVGGDLAAVANMIKIEDLTRTQLNENENGEDNSLVIDSSATGDESIPFVHTSNLMQHKAADAIEGLQALAGQAGFIIEEEVQGTEKQQTIVIEQNGEVLSTSSTTLPDGSIVISTDEGIVEEQIAIDTSGSDQITQIVEAEETLDVGSGLTSLELTEEQLSSLQHGDMIQIEGQVYLVELTQDPESPDKQLLSFLPVTQA